jgi:integrase
MKAMRKSQLPYRRMYETRHTFASWALAAGESPEWVARTLGHVIPSFGQNMQTKRRGAPECAPS